MPSDLVLDVRGAPDAALSRLTRALAERPKRALGVLKTRNEFVGAIADDRFEVWERRQRAIHAVGAVRGRRGGTRVEVSFRMTPVAKGLLALFTLLYVVVAYGIATQPPDPSVTTYEIAVAVLGAAVVAALFYGGAERQRRDLADFLSRALSAPDAPTSARAGLSLPVDERGQPRRELREEVQKDHREDL